MEKDILVSDIINIGDNKNCIKVIDNEGNVLFNGRMERASYQSDGTPHKVLTMKVLFLESIKDVTYLYV